MEQLSDNYRISIIKTTSAPERLEKSQQLVQNLCEILLTDVTVTTDSCVTLIPSLIRVTLDSEHTTSELQDFLLSQEVVKLVRDLVTATGDAGVILQGLIEGVSKKGVGFENTGNYNPKLLHTWFIAGDYTPKTQPGFLLSVFVFMLKCADRQQEVCGWRSYSIQQTDDHLLPLVRAALTTETQKSINAGDEKYMNTDLHFAAGCFLLPSVTREIIKHPHINVNVRNRARSTPLGFLVWEGLTLGTRHLPLFTALLSHPDTDVSIPDNKGKTPVDHLCSHLIKPESDTNTALQMIQQICQHKTVTAQNIWSQLVHISTLELSESVSYERNATLSVLANSEQLNIRAAAVIPCPPNADRFIKSLAAACPDKLPQILNKLDISQATKDTLQQLFGQTIKLKDLFKFTNTLIIDILHREDFAVNCGIDDGMTAGHLVAGTGSSNLMEELLKRKDLDVNIQDNLGNTLLFYMCEHYPRQSAISYIEKLEISWDFSVKNKLGQTVYDYYRDVDRRDPYLLKMLQKKGGQEDNVKVAAPRSITVVLLPERPIDWRLVTPPGGAVVKVLPSTLEFYRSKVNKIRDRKIYEVTKSTKGKVCILSVPEFRARGLDPLPGYEADRENLTQLWSEMGFVVYTTRYDGQYHLTAKELKQAVKEFAAKLTDTDQCAVLCILSHGGDGFIYGSDGGKVEIRNLLSNLDNKNCAAMKGKPKVIILQTCQGNKFDVGITASPAGNVGLEAVAAADKPKLPSISDFIQCSPSMQGYTSFVWTDPTKGSVFINAVVEIFSKHARNEDIYSLLTWVNEEVGSELIPVTVTGSNHTVDHKQMSNFTSCLTKLLYFFPCPGGRNGQNW